MFGNRRGGGDGTGDGRRVVLCLWRARRAGEYEKKISPRWIPSLIPRGNERVLCYKPTSLRVFFVLFCVDSLCEQRIKSPQESKERERRKSINNSAKSKIREREREREIRALDRSRWTEGLLLIFAAFLFLIFPPFSPFPIETMACFTGCSV